MIVNLNVLCKVQLNELGKVIWISQLDELPEEVVDSRPDIVAEIHNKIDENDCIEMELWRIMNIFGRYISDKSSPFTRCTIELNKNPNFFKQVDN